MVNFRARLLVRMDHRITPLGRFRDLRGGPVMTE